MSAPRHTTAPAPELAPQPPQAEWIEADHDHPPLGDQYAFDLTLEYVKERQAFGQPIGSFQHSKFKMAEMAPELELGWAFIDKCVMAHNEQLLTAEEAAMAKWWTTELQKRVNDTCLQLHGGYGYMDEYPISRLWRDGRVQSIYGGTTEIMKEIISKLM